MTRFVIGTLLAFQLVIPASAQRPASLAPANAKLAQEFSELSSVRELSDGRVLITDRIESKVVVADLTTGRVTAIGRVGDGPLEYRMALPLAAAAGNQSIMLGMPGTRWTLFDGDKIVGTLAPDAPVIKAVPFPYGFDRDGHVLTTISARSPRGSAEDSAFLVRVVVSTGTSDTIGRLGSVAAASLPRGEQRPIYTVYDQAVLALDGWVAVLRGAPYRVDWRSPDDRWIVGHPISTPVVKMDARERQAFLDRRSDAAKKRGAITDWPTTIPPVTAGWPPMVTMDGRLLVRRTPTADFPTPLYDVVNRQGIRERQILMPQNSRIVGFGAHSVYVVNADDSGIEHLTRHPWP